MAIPRPREQSNPREGVEAEEVRGEDADVPRDVQHACWRAGTPYAFYRRWRRDKYAYLRKLVALVQEKQALRDETSREASIAHGHWELNPDVTTLKARDATYEVFQRAVDAYDAALSCMQRWVRVGDVLELLAAHPEKPATDTRPWCWRRPGEELCEGPFETREAAIHDARHDHAEEGVIEVGRCTPVLDAYPTIDAEAFCDWVNDVLCDYGLEGATAVVENVDEADEALRAWAGKYIKVEGYEWVIADEEDVYPEEDEA